MKPPSKVKVIGISETKKYIVKAPSFSEAWEAVGFSSIWDVDDICVMPVSITAVRHHRCPDNANIWEITVESVTAKNKADM